MSEKIPSRDITGVCEGECRDRVLEGMRSRQSALEHIKVASPDFYPNAPNAWKRKSPPGWLGGHV